MRKFGFGGQKKGHFPREPREDLNGEVIVRRPGKTTYRSKAGNISEGGVFIELAEHDLQKGRKAELVVVRNNQDIHTMQHMSGIVIRVEERGVAFVTYNRKELKDKHEIEIAELDTELNEVPELDENS